jgi:uncharacterized protein YyaL (SSP411 family)
VILRGPRPELHDWARALAVLYLPDTLVVALDSTAKALPAALDKPAGAGVNAYLCHGVTCMAPIQDRRSLLEALKIGR